MKNKQNNTKKNNDLFFIISVSNLLFYVKMVDFMNFSSRHCVFPLVQKERGAYFKQNTVYRFNVQWLCIHAYKNVISDMSLLSKSFLQHLL